MIVDLSIVYFPLYSDGGSNKYVYKTTKIPVQEIISNHDTYDVYQQQRIFDQIWNMDIEFKKSISFPKNYDFPKSGILKLKANFNNLLAILK